MVAANIIPETIMVDSPEAEERDVMTIQEWQDKLLGELDLSGLDLWMPKHREKVKDLLPEFHDMFALEDSEMGQREVMEHNIELTDEKPFKERPWNMPKGLLEEMKEHLDHMLDVGAITPSNSAWSNTVILVQKKDGGLRFCIDFRKLNTHTKKDAYPLPHSHDTISTLRGSHYYTTVDLLSRFWQTPMVEDSKKYTAFTVGMLGFFQCECMLFGLCNGPGTFQHLMQSCLGELNFTTCLVYLDDVVIFTATPEEHLNRL